MTDTSSRPKGLTPAERDELKARYKLPNGPVTPAHILKKAGVRAQARRDRMDEDGTPEYRVVASAILKILLRRNAENVASGGEADDIFAQAVERLKLDYDEDATRGYISRLCSDEIELVETGAYPRRNVRR